MTTKEYIELTDTLNKEETLSERVYNEVLDKIKDFNKDLISRYPWLTPRNRWTDKIPEDYNYSYTELDSMPRGWRLAFGDQMVDEIHQELTKYKFVDKYRILQIKEKYGSLRWYDSGTPIGKLSKTYRAVSTMGTPWLPNYDKETEVLKEVSRDHYIPFYDREKSGMTDEELQKYNLDAVYHYRIYKILEKCRIPSIIAKYEEMSAFVCITCGKTAEWESTGWISPYCTECAKSHFKVSDQEKTKDPEYFKRFFTPINNLLTTL